MDITTLFVKINLKIGYIKLDIENYHDVKFVIMNIYC
jgi:hypothetical protein